MARIPPAATKVFSGILFDVWQWEQQLYNGQTKVFELMRRTDKIQVIPVLPDGKILMLEQTQASKEMRYPSFVSGRIAEGELPIDAAKRKLLAETGMISDDISSFTSYEPSHKIDYKIHVFVARNCQKVQDQLLDPGEKIKLTPMSFDQCMEILVSDEYEFPYLTNHLLKLERKGQLGEFKKKLGII